MHSIRCAALRAASSSNAMIAGTPRQKIASLAMQFSKASVRPATALSTARFFSRTARVGQDENPSVEEPVTPAPAAPSGTNAARSHSIFVKNMSYDATPDHLKEAFSKYGEVKDARISRDENGNSRGFGWVDFAEPSSVKSAVEEAHHSFWHGRRIVVAPSRSIPTARKPADPSPSLYIGNIAYDTSDADLNKMFRELDGVLGVRVAVDRNTGWPRGFAHADFADQESATAALNKLRDQVLGGRKLRVDYSAPRRGGASESESESS